jgi:hypothetical protein
MSEIRTDTINNASGDNDSGIDLSTNDQVKIKTANTTALTVDASQNVGIGTSSPNNYTDYVALTLNGTNGGEIDFEKAGTVNGSLFNPSGTSDFQVVAANASGNLRFSAGGYSEDMRILSNGDIAINSTTTNTSGFSSAHLKIDADSSKNSMIVSSNRQNHVAYGIHADNNTGIRYAMYILNASGGEVGKISYTSSAVTYATTSDHRVKENVEDMTGAIDRVKQLLPKRFNFIADDTNTLVDGFLAHEAQSVVAEAVTGTHNEVDDDDNPVMQGIDQAKLVPLLTGALKEAIAKIEALETRVTALENS